MIAAQRRRLALALALAASCCAHTSVFGPAAFPGDACSGYRFKAQASGEVVKLTITVDGATDRYIGTLTFRSSSQGAATFTFAAEGSDPAVEDRPPAATAVIESQRICHHFGAEDVSTDPCIAERIHAPEFCISTAP